MAMSNHFKAHQTLCPPTATLLLLMLLLHILLSPASSFTHRQQHRRRMVVLEDKSRLGSTPPSCHNRCNNCHPCMAVQVPTGHALPGDNPAQPASSEPGFFDPSTASTSLAGSSGYSNYKPLGWKCRCRDRLFDP